MRDRVPVGLEVDRGDDVDEQRATEIAEQPLDPAKRQEVHDHHEPQCRDQGERAYFRVQQQLEDDRDAADLRRQRQQIDRQRRDKRDHPGAQPKPHPHDIKHRAPGHGRDAAGHLGEHHDPDDAKRHDPQQLKSERRAGLHVEHQLADIDEPADRGNNPKRNLQHLLHSRSANLPACWA